VAEQYIARKLGGTCSNYCGLAAALSRTIAKGTLASGSWLKHAWNVGDEARRDQAERMQQRWIMRTKQSEKVELIGGISPAAEHKQLQSM
jgi:hypothetical protein